MSVPLRKGQPEEEFSNPEELTTADLAQGKHPVTSHERMRPVLAERPSDERNQDEAAPEDLSRNNSEIVHDSEATNGARSVSDNAPLFPSNELQGLRTRWSDVQAAFVDEPRRAVEQADGLVASAMKRLAEVFAEERSRLEQQWDRGDNVSTEDLRLALQRYRSFFHRLLSI
jgi:hypothetical protein